jgi:polysaccharide biosynthesis protein PslG
VSTGGGVEWSSDADLARQMDGMKQIGAGTIRFDIKWSAVESSRGSFNWTLYDRMVNYAKARGIKVLANLAYTPGWARPSTCTSDDKCAPANIADYVTFARNAVARYAPMGVRVFEIWNEPNIPMFWKPRPDPVRYSEMVKATYPALKAVDPGITVLAGAFSPAGGYRDSDCNNVSDTSAPGGHINGIDFLEAMYRNGVAGKFDALAHHPYTGWAGVFDTHRCNAWHQMAGTSPSLRSVMTANGDGAKRIWATEFGTDVAWVNNNEQTQAQHLTDAFRQWLTYPWAGDLMYYAYKQELPGFNLLRGDWSARPSWYAFKAAPKG